MRIPFYIQCNRYGIYYFRRAVPTALLAQIGKTEIIRSLRTREPKEAIRLARINTIITDQYFDEVRMAKKNEDTPSLDFITTFTLPNQTKVKREVTPSDIAAMKDAGLSPEQIADVLKSSPLPATTEQLSFRSSADQPEVTLQLMVTRYVEHWEAEHGGREIAKTRLTKFRRLTEILGSDTPLSEITIESAELVRKTLAKLPANTARFRGFTVNQVVNATQDKTIDRLSKKTQNDHLEEYSSLFKYAKQVYRWLSVNPFDGIRVRVSAKEKAAKVRSGFTREQIQQIFSSPIHTTPDLTYPYRYWAPLIALFTGARRGSISALYLHDFKLEDDVWIIDFNENEKDKSEKTKNGFRKTPIHPFLIDIGLLKYVDHLKANGDTRLFPDLGHWTEEELYGRAIGDWFNGSGARRPGFLHKRGIRGNKGQYVFHSFRHTITTELRRAGADALAVEQICGRSEGSKTLGQTEYTDPDLLSTLHKKISLVDYKKELSEVKPYTSTITIKTI